MAQTAKILAFPVRDQKLAFTPMKIEFPSNQQWASNHLPMVRVALRIASFDRAGVDESLSSMLQTEGLIPNLLDVLARTKDHLQGLSELIDTVLARSFVALGDMGYSPDNPPK